jgi:hypothetical protein
LHAKTAESITGGIAETDPFFNKSVAKNIKASDTTRWGNINEVKITAGKNVTVSGSGTTVVPYVISAGISGSRLKVPTHTAMGTTGPWDTCRNSCVRLGSGWHIPTFEEETYIASGAIGIPTGGWATTTNSVWTSSQWDTRVGTAPSANGWVVMNESGSWGAYGWGTVSVGCRCVIDSDTARVYPTQTAMGPTGSFETCRNSCVALGNGWHIPTFEDETYITSGVIGLPTGGWSTNGVWTSTPWDSRVTNAPGAGVWVVMSETGTWTGLGELTVSVGCRCVR